jgi:hypothetical protein
MTTKYSPGFLSHTEKNLLRKQNLRRHNALYEFNKDDRTIDRFRQATNVSLKPRIKK